jgi:hypothetical protein
MSQIPWGTAIAVFVGTLPIFGLLTWNLIEVKSIRAELIQIRTDIAAIRERLATLEERDRIFHGPLIK